MFLDMNYKHDRPNRFVYVRGFFKCLEKFLSFSFFFFLFFFRRNNTRGSYYLVRFWIKLKAAGKDTARRHGHGQLTKIHRSRNWMLT